MKQKLNKLERYWVMYDVGNSAFALLVSTIIPIYFKNMAAGNGISASDSTAYLSYAISISTLIVAILGPVLGTVADGKNRKKPLFTLFMLIGVLGCAALALPKSAILFLVVFMIGFIVFKLQAGPVHRVRRIFINEDEDEYEDEDENEDDYEIGDMDFAKERF